MNVQELFAVLDNIAPFKDSEAWDNTGLLVGDMQSEVTGVLTTLDCGMETVDEAIQNDINVIVAHHPLIFPEISRITEEGTGSIISRLMKIDLSLHHSLTDELSSCQYQQAIQVRLLRTERAE